MTPLESELLAALLGQLDALFWPVDFAWDGPPPAFQSQWQRRDKYLGRYDWTGAGLLPWENRGEDQAEKKRYSRAMAALKDQKLIRMEGKAVGLTDAGLIAARKLCGHLQLEDCLLGLDALLSFIKTRHEWNSGEGTPGTGFISEASLAGFNPWPPGKIGKPRLPDYWVESAMLPLAIAGLVDDAFRKDFELPLYRLTNDGRKLAEQRRRTGQAAPKSWPKLKKRISQYREPAAYRDAWEKEIEAQPNMKPPQASRVTHPAGDIWPAEERGKIMK